MAYVLLLRKLLTTDQRAASQLLIAALATPKQFADFIDAEKQKDLHAAIGEAITLVLTLANQQPQQFLRLFTILHTYYEKFLQSDQPEIVLHVCLALYVFFSYFLRKNATSAVQQAEKRMGDKYPAVFAEFVIFEHLQGRRLTTAWKYEQAGHLLDLLAGRESAQLEMVSALICLHRMHGDACETQLEILELKYGQKNLNAEVQRMGQYVSAEYNVEAVRDGKQ